jgi:hypothetical protein
MDEVIRFLKRTCCLLLVLSTQHALLRVVSAQAMVVPVASDPYQIQANGLLDPNDSPDGRVSISTPTRGFRDTGSWTGEVVGARLSESDAVSQGLNFNEFPREFKSGISIINDRWAVKFGGYAKADLIYDARPIDSEDFFDPSTIPVGSPDRTNTRFHARQTRLNMDARWRNESNETVRFLIEGDFFGDDETLRLRHAYGEFDGWIFGKTWTTFTHRAALPNTLDVVGDVASVGRRQAQMRWSTSLWREELSVAIAVEDPSVIIDPDLASFGSPRTSLPDFIARLRWSGDHGQFQLASLVRRVGFQPFGNEVLEETGAGINATAYRDLTKKARFYGGILWGNGIGSYRDLPDVALTSPTTGDTLSSVAWYSGLTHHWSSKWLSNVTYSEGRLSNAAFQSNSSIHQLTYLAVNLIYQPTKHTFVGVEGLWGDRTNKDLTNQDASRFMMSMGLLLP